MKGSARELADPWYETSTETGDWFYFKAFSFLSTLLSSSSADCCGAAGRAASEIIPEVGPLSAVRLAGEGNTGRQLAAPAATAGMRQKEHGWGQAHAGWCTSAPGRNGVQSGKAENPSGVARLLSEGKSLFWRTSGEISCLLLMAGSKTNNAPTLNHVFRTCPKY